MSRIISIFGILCLLWVSFPLAVVAAFTTVMAFSALFLRVSIVYLELLFALVFSWTSVMPPTPRSRTPRRISPSGSIAGIQGRTVSKNSAMQSFHYTLPMTPSKQLAKIASFSSVVGASGTTRDFEGVGGWQLTGNGEEDAIWMAMNSRLELPTPVGQSQRRHQRSLSSQSIRFTPRSPAVLRNSPLEMRARQPQTVDGHTSPEGYFNMHPPHERPATSPEESEAKLRSQERRMSLDTASVATSLMM